MKASVQLWQQLWLGLSFLWVSRLDWTFEGVHQNAIPKYYIYHSKYTFPVFTDGVGKSPGTADLGNSGPAVRKSSEDGANMGTSQQIHPA